jgi:Ca-activated chloride channel homolog
MTPSVFFAQTAHKMLRKGDAEYMSKDYKTAEENYRKANEAERSHKGSFNLGNTIYLQQRYDEAIKQYEDAAGRAKTNDLKANALYNKGNAHFWKNDYANAEKAYKESLMLNPNDADAKRNLAMVKKLIKRQGQQQQQNQKNKDQDKDKNKKDDKQNDKQDPKDDKQNQDKNNPENKDQKGKDQQQKDQNQDIDQNAQNNRPESTPAQDLKKEEAKRMLQIMDDEERKVQQRLKKGKAKPSKSDKDW